MEKEEIAKGLEKMLDSFLEERKDIALKISSLSGEKRSLDEKIEDINRSYIHLTGKSYKGLSEFRTAADLAEELLTEFGKLHVDQILELIKIRKMANGREIPKASLVATLVRYANSNKRFERVKDESNTFALIKEKEDKNKKK